MRKIIFAALLGGLPCLAAAMQDEDISEQLVSTDTMRAAEDDEQVVIQESDSDLTSFVRDYVERDTQLKGSFLLDPGKGGPVLRLKLSSIAEKTSDAPEGDKLVTAFFTDGAGKKYQVRFRLSSSSFGGTEIAAIEPAASGGPAPANKK